MIISLSERQIDETPAPQILPHSLISRQETSCLLVDAENQTDILKTRTESTETAKTSIKTSATSTDPIQKDMDEDSLRRTLEIQIRKSFLEEKIEHEKMIQELKDENQEFRHKIQLLLSQEKEYLKIQRERDSMLLKNAEFSNTIDKMRKELEDEQNDRKELQKEYLLLKELIEGKEKAEKEKPVLNKSDHEAIVQKLEETIAERNRTIKNQQQRITDIKKSIQRGDFPSLKNEMHGYCSDDSGSISGRVSPGSISRDINGHHNHHNPNNHHNNGSGHRSKSPPATLDVSNNPSNTLVNNSYPDNPLEVNFEYLKNVIFKFITSSDPESQKQLIKAISTLLKFNSDQEKLIRQTLEWKTSWLSALPLVGPNLKPGNSNPAPSQHPAPQINIHNSNGPPGHGTPRPGNRWFGSFSPIIFTCVTPAC